MALAEARMAAREIAARARIAIKRTQLGQKDVAITPRMRMTIKVVARLTEFKQKCV